MRTMLPLGTVGFVLAFGCVAAQGIPLGNQAFAANAMFGEQLLTSNSVTAAFVGRPGFTIDGRRDASAAEPAQVDRTSRIDAKTGMRKFILLAIFTAVAGFGAVAASALRRRDGGDACPGGAADQFAYELLRDNLANLDGLKIGHHAHGT